jgi:SynChlorMet cassette protein ScmC
MITTNYNFNPINAIKLLLTSENVYCLRLANGQGWQIVATEAVSSWVEKLAMVMQLKTCEPNGYPKLIFIKRVSVKGGLEELTRIIKQKTITDIPVNNWKAHSLGNLQLWSHHDVLDVICEIGRGEDHELDIIRMWLSLHPIYQRVQGRGGLPIHAALIEYNGIGVLIAASGNTGKSTCCHRLPFSWHALCDDETLIVRDDNRKYFVHPFPTWSDYLYQRSKRTWNVQQHFPLSAIFFLEQSEIDEAVSIGQGEAATLINKSAVEVCRRSWWNLDRSQEMSFRKELFDNACELAKEIRTYRLRVSINGRFWEKIEEVLS